MSTPNGKLYGVGVGPGDPDLLTLKAAKVLGRVDLVLAAASTKNDYSLALSIAAPHLRPGVPVERLSFPMTRDRDTLQSAWERNALRVSQVLGQGLEAAFLTLGDPMTYSTFGYLLRTLRDMGQTPDVEVVPGITSYQAAAARTQTPLAEAGENLCIIPGTTAPERLAGMLDQADNAVILKTYRNFAAIRQALRDRGLDGRARFVTRLGLDGEMVADLEDAPENPHYFSLVLAHRN